MVDGRRGMRGRGVFLLDQFVWDVRSAMRTLRAGPSFTAIAVVTLALGIGANTAVFSVVDAVLLHPIPFAEPERLVALHGTSSTTTKNSVAYADLLDWQRQSTAFEALAAWRLDMFTLTGDSGAERLIGGRVSSTYFSILRVRPLLGRTFHRDDDRVGARPVVLLGEGLWRRRFAADPRAIGTDITLDGRPFTVVGIVPANVGLGVIARRYNDVFLPIGQYDDELFLSRGVHATLALGRLRPGVTLAEARAEMDTIAKRLAAVHPATNTGVGINVVPVHEDLVGHLQPTIALLLGAVGFVLLIACANVANLVLVRSTGRAHEFAIRVALGASRGRIVRQAITESMLLALTGGVAGAGLAGGGTRAALRVLPSALPDMVDVTVNSRVFLFAAATAALAGLISGGVPALAATRRDTRDLLQQRGWGGAVRRDRAQHVFLVTQVALAVTLLVGAGLMARSLVLLWRVDPGFDPAGVVTFMTGLSRDRASDPERVRATLRALDERLSAVPGVQAASVVFGALPFTGNNNAVDVWRAGEPKPLGGAADLALFSAVGPNYLRAMRIPLLRGRAFTLHDHSSAPRVLLIDEALARSVYPGQNPIGQRLHLDPLAEPAEVIGVVGHVKQSGLDADAAVAHRFQVYVPHMQLPDGLAAMAAAGVSGVVRSDTPAAAVLGSVKDAIRSFDSGQGLNNEKVMEVAIASSLAGRRFSLVLLAAFAGLALILSTVGTYGVATYLVAQRTREIGVRVALGARRSDVLRVVLGGGGRMAFVGIVLGIGASAGLARFLGGMLFGVTATDPVTLAAVAVLLLLVTLAACYVPARRALRLDPSVALRHD